MASFNITSASSLVDCLLNSFGNDHILALNICLEAANILNTFKEQAAEGQNSIPQEQLVNKKLLTYTVNKSEDCCCSASGSATLPPVDTTPPVQTSAISRDVLVPHSDSEPELTPHEQPTGISSISSETVQYLCQFVMHAESVVALSRTCWSLKLSLIGCPLDLTCFRYSWTKKYLIPRPKNVFNNLVTLRLIPNAASGNVNPLNSGEAREAHSHHPGDAHKAWTSSIEPIEMAGVLLDYVSKGSLVIPSHCRSSAQVIQSLRKFGFEYCWSVSSLMFSEVYSTEDFLDFSSRYTGLSQNIRSIEFGISAENDIFKGIDKMVKLGMLPNLREIKFSSSDDYFAEVDEDSEEKYPEKWSDEYSTSALEGVGEITSLCKLDCFSDIVESMDLQEDDFYSPIKGDIDSLSKLVNLVHVNLKHSSGVHGNLTSLESLPKLEYLNLSGTSLGGNIVSLAKLVNLKYLYLHPSNDFFQVAEMSLSGNLTSLSGLTKLCELEIAESIDIEGDIVALERFANMEELVLCNTERIVGNVESLSGMNNLRLLNVSDSLIGGDLLALKHLKFLVEISVYGSNVEHRDEFYGRTPYKRRGYGYIAKRGVFAGYVHEATPQFEPPVSWNTSFQSPTEFQHPLMFQPPPFDENGVGSAEVQGSFSIGDYVFEEE